MRVTHIIFPNKFFIDLKEQVKGNPESYTYRNNSGNQSKISE